MLHSFCVQLLLKREYCSVQNKVNVNVNVKIVIMELILYRFVYEPCLTRIGLKHVIETKEDEVVAEILQFITY